MRKLVIITIITIILFSILVLSQSDIRYTQVNPIYNKDIVLASGEWPPYVSEYIEHEGIVSRIVREAFEIKGLEVEFVYLPWTQSMEESKKGNYHGTLPWVKNKERENNFYFSDPIATENVVFFYHNNLKFQWENISDLYGLKIGGTEEYYYGEEFALAETSGRLNIDRVKTDKENFDRLFANELDIVICEITVGYDILINHFPNKLESITYDSKPISTNSLHLLLSKNLPENSELIEIFNNGLINLNEAGKIKSYWNDFRQGELKIYNSSVKRIRSPNQLKLTSIEFGKLSIKQKAQDVAKQIEIYLKTNQDKTLEDLRNDSYFNEIAVQKVGETGYTAVTDYDNLVAWFHPNSNIIGTSLTNLEEKLPSFFAIMKKTQGGYDSDGVYAWKEADGTIKDKYMYIAVVNQKTADDIGLHVAATTYLDEYELLKEEIPLVKKQSLNYIYLIIPVTLLVLLSVGLYVFGIIKFEKNFIIALLGLALVIIIGLSVINTYQMTQSLKTEKINSIHKNLISLAVSRTNHIETFIQTHKDVIKIIGSPAFTEDIFSSKQIYSKFVDIDHQLEEMQEKIDELVKIEKDILKITLLDKDGKVILSSDNSTLDLLKPEIMNAFKIDGVYIKKTHWSNGFDKPAFDYALPIYDEDKLVGGVIIDIDLTSLYTITTDTTGLGKSGEVYIINDEKLMITPSRFLNDTFLSQKIDTENAKECFNDYEKYVKNNIVEPHEETILTYNDYRNKSVFGTHAYVPELKWCLLAEVDEQEELANLNTEIRNMWFFTVMIIISLIIIAFVFNYLLTKSLRKEIEEKTLETRKINLNLEKTVEERTKELKELNEHLEYEIRERTDKLNEKVKESEDIKKATLNILEDVDESNKELTKAKEELDKHIKELQLIDKTKDEFLSVTAHELKTPLTSIRGFVELLKNDSVINNKQSREKYFDIIISDTRRLANLITDILDLSRMDVGSLKFTYEKVSIKEIFDDLINSYDEQFHAKNLDHSFLIHGTIPQLVTDKARITQVISNLINNAIHYTEKGKITIDAHKIGNFVNFTVTDSGTGIPKEELSKIFNRFYQVDSSFTRKIGGSGLGLAICKGIVEALGGQINVKSELDKGTQFNFTLPLSSEQKQDERIKIFNQESS